MHSPRALARPSTVGYLRLCFSRQILLLLMVLLAVGVSTAQALTFSFTNGPGLVALLGGSPAQQALANNVIAGFNTAGNQWSSSFVDPITINVAIDLASLPTGVLAGTSTNTQQATFSSVRTGLTTDITTLNDVQAVAGLPLGASLSFYTNDRAGVKFLDNDGSNNNSFLDLAQANAKAIGLRGANDPANDGSITFSSGFTYDFAHGPSITPGTIDFVGVAIHEIGHTMGYFSGVDIVDIYSGAGPNAGVDLNGATAGTGTLDPFRIYSVLDLYRHSATANTISLTTLDLASGDTPFFSLDGTTNLGRFATGQFNGDNRQAGHWKDGLGLGIMDPSLGFGELGVVTPLDRLAMDVIGFNLVPEPSAYLTGVMSLVALVALCVGRGKSRRHAATA